MRTMYGVSRATAGIICHKFYNNNNNENITVEVVFLAACHYITTDINNNNNNILHAVLGRKKSLLTGEKDIARRAVSRRA